MDFAEKILALIVAAASGILTPFLFRKLTKRSKVAEVAGQEVDTTGKGVAVMQDAVDLVKAQDELINSRVEARCKPLEERIAKLEEVLCKKEGEIFEYTSAFSVAYTCPYISECPILKKKNNL